MRLEGFAKSRGYSAGYLVCEGRLAHPLKPQDYKELSTVFERAGFRKIAYFSHSRMANSSD